MDRGYAAPPPVAGGAVGSWEVTIVNAFMRRVYYWMAAGLSLSGAIAYLVLTSPAFMLLFFNPATGPTGLFWAALIGELVLVFAFIGLIKRVSVGVAMAMFIVYAALNGITIGLVLLFYTGASVVKTFLVTAGTFGAVSVWASTTKKDLSAWGSFLFMGLIGVIIASLVNMFFRSPMMEWVISIIGVIVFTGLTAYDTQKLRAMVLEAANEVTVSKMAVYGALQLYLDFINLFLFLLRLMGGGRD